MPEGSSENPDDYGNPDPEWLKIEWRRHLRRVALPGAEVSYVEIGEGEPILFVHGIAGSWQNWLENLPHFGRGHRAIALDLPGFGHSPMPSWPIEVDAYGRLVHDFCEKIGIERGGTLVGNSMGGLVAAEAVLSSPGRFDRLALVSSAGLIKSPLGDRQAFAISRSWGAVGPRFSRASRPLVSGTLGRYLAFRPFVRYPGRLRPELLWEQMSSGLRALGLGEALKAEAEHDAGARLEEIEIPTMIVWGSSDFFISARSVLSYHRRVPHSRLEIFARTGHLPQLERPARFNRLLDEFLAA
jgi:pimeloyl-ACP methyl ester carboxylesterase